MTMTYDTYLGGHVDGIIYGIYGIYGIKDTYVVCKYVKNTVLELGFMGFSITYTYLKP
jgi:hypothetical protein